MKVINFKDIDKQNLKIDSLCLGSFDGFHLGHQKLINEAIINSLGDTAILLFSNHPGKYLNKSIKEIMNLDDKLRFINNLKIDYAIVIDVNENFFKLSKEEFIDRYLKVINPKSIYVGEDFTFGQHGIGNMADLQGFFKTVVVPLLEKDGEKISSTLIRECLLNGNIKKANGLLGHNFEIKGVVEKGLQNGRNFGFPTANISMKENEIYPSNGVYVALTYVNGIPYKSMVNIGIHPTVDKLNKPVIESYILDFDNSIYGKTIYIEFLDKIRDEKKFANVSELIEQLNKDKLLVIKSFNY